MLPHSADRTIAILIYSMNPAKAAAMAEKLDSAGFWVTRTPMDRLSERQFREWVRDVQDLWADRTGGVGGLGAGPALDLWAIESLAGGLRQIQTLDTALMHLPSSCAFVRAIWPAARGKAAHRIVEDMIEKPVGHKGAKVCTKLCYGNVSHRQLNH